MADNPHGFNPVKHKLGVPLSATVNPYYKKADYAVALFVGDPVVKNGTANLAEVNPGAEAFASGELPELAIGALTGGNTGVVVGKMTRSGNLETIHSAASIEDVILVCDDPYVVFSAQEDSGAGNMAATSVGLNTDLLIGTGDAVTGISGAEIDSSEIAATATLAVKVLRLAPDQGNAIGANAEWHVLMNAHTEAPNSAGI